MNPKGKSLIKSKVFWFNVLTVIIQIAVYLETAAPAEYIPYTTAIQAIGNIILRYITTQKITSLV